MHLFPNVILLDNCWHVTGALDFVLLDFRSLC